MRQVNNAQEVYMLEIFKNLDKQAWEDLRPKALAILLWFIDISIKSRLKTQKYSKKLKKYLYDQINA